MSNSEPERTAGGLLIVISGPSGAGKTSICNALLKDVSDTIWSVSATTRPPREGEVSGQSYEFINPDEFARRKEANEFLEWAQYVGHQYGTLRTPVMNALERGQRVVLEIDVQGGMQIAKSMPESVRIFVLPPDQDSLRSRLEGRNTEAKEQMMKRLAQADGEIAIARDSGCYQHFVVNDVLDKTIEDVKRIIQQERRC